MTFDDSPYRAPGSALDRPAEGNRRAIEDAIAGNFELRVGDILSEAWRLVSGSKAVLLGGFAITMGVAIATQGVSALASGEDAGLAALFGFVATLVGNAISYTINGGMLLFAIKRAAGDESASFDDVLAPFGQIGAIFLLTLLQGLLILLGLVLLIAPGIYLAIGYTLALQLKVERGLGVWESLETSRRAVHNCWLRMALLLLATGLLVGAGTVLTLGVGLIWLGPFGLLVFGVAYREVFGYAPVRA